VVGIVRATAAGKGTMPGMTDAWTAPGSRQGGLGAPVIRCVVSVSMLTEGWDANTVTHVLGVRAFGTQLLCEQGIGRALRRQSYELNEDGPDKGLFNVECSSQSSNPVHHRAAPNSTSIPKSSFTFMSASRR
jgi:type III restriction enzyme